MSLTRLVARPLLASAFIVDGFDAAIRPAGHVARFKKVAPAMERAGLPPVLTADATMLTRAVGVISALSGLMLATGRNPRSAALTLAVINIPLTVVNNPAWTARSAAERKEQVSGLLRGAGIAGGLLLAAADLAGKPSLSWRYANAKDHRAELREVRTTLKQRYKS
jgi:uncharacterized membrane protein YphA (DoxX/SURF4 family)